MDALVIVGGWLAFTCIIITIWWFFLRSRVDSSGEEQGGSARDQQSAALAAAEHRAPPSSTRPTPVKPPESDARRPRDLAQSDDSTEGAAEATQTTTATLWEVRDDTGQSSIYDDEEKLVEAVLAGSIQPDSDARRITKTVKVTAEGKSSEEVSQSEWAKASEQLLTSDFKVRVLHQPVWAHSISGAFYGGFLGASAWLAALAILLLQNENWGAAAAVAFFFGLASQPLSSALLPTKAAEFFSRLFLMGPLLALAPAMTIGQLSFSELFSGVTSGAMMQFTASICGALFGIPAGMIAGTLVGYARRGALQLAPFATTEATAPVVRGVLIPAAGLSLLLWVYLKLFLPWASGFLES